MNWLSTEGITIIGILILSAVADILFITLLYKDLIKLFKSTHPGIKILALSISVGLCIPLIIALHRFTIFFLIHHIAYIWLFVMILFCTVLALNLFKLIKRNHMANNSKQIP